jgi:hypothetical protein
LWSGVAVVLPVSTVLASATKRSASREFKRRKEENMRYLLEKLRSCPLEFKGVKSVFNQLSLFILA